MNGYTQISFDDIEREIDTGTVSIGFDQFVNRDTYCGYPAAPKNEILDQVVYIKNTPLFYYLFHINT